MRCHNLRFWVRSCLRPSSKEKTEKESTPTSEKELTPDKTESSPKPKEAASETAQENNNIEEQKKDVNYNDYSLEALQYCYFLVMLLKQFL